MLKLLGHLLRRFYRDTGEDFQTFTKVNAAEEGIGLLLFNERDCIVDAHLGGLHQVGGDNGGGALAAHGTMYEDAARGSGIKGGVDK